VDGVRISSNALSSVAATLANPHGLSEQEKVAQVAFEELVSKCVLKPSGHDRPLVTFPHRALLFTVTTITSLPRYGGNRTPIICDNFTFAKRVVEENLGDIYECSYTLAVIESVEPNRMYPGLGAEREAYWYMWQGDSMDGAYHAIEVPSGMEDHVAQPIG
jgi:hypothetical protein